MDWLADGLPTGYRLMAAQATDGKTKILKMYIKIIKILFHYYTTTRKTFPLCNTKPNLLERVLRQMPLKQYNAIFIRIRFIFHSNQYQTYALKYILDIERILNHKTIIILELIAVKSLSFLVL